jgi:ribosomal-protein-alanine acetyltransferase
MIRRAGVEELAALIAAERAVASAPHWSEAVWEETLRSERATFVAEQEGALVGLVVGHMVAGVVELESIAVSAGARRTGVGTNLVAALQAWAREGGANAMELEVRASNAEAIGFYRELGFQEAGRRNRYYSDPVEDAVLMTAKV